MTRAALFLDRDGVINVDSGYVCRPEDFRWLDGIFETVRRANACGLECIVVTNQAGIARGYYSEEDFQSLTAWMLHQFAERDAAIAAVYYCPYHPDGIGRYRHPDHPDRKPNPGMLLRAARERDLDLAQSVMIGDQESDIVAAVRAGVGHIAWLGGPEMPRADHVTTVRSHAEAGKWLESRSYPNAAP